MSAKIFVVCAAFVFVKTISAQSIGSALAAEELALRSGALGLGPGLNGNNFYGASAFGAYGPQVPGFGLNPAPSSGGGFAVTSYSPFAPTGIHVFSENAIEGPLSIAGELPFLGAVTLEGALPTSGAGGINYGCGNGVVGIVSEGIAPGFPSAPAAAIPPNRFGYGPGLPASGLNSPGFGFGPMY